MEYFTKELWHGVNDSDESVRKAAEEAWKRNSAAYWAQFEAVAQVLPQPVLTGLKARDFFHDYIIAGLSLSKDGEQAYSGRLQLSDGVENVTLTMNGLAQFTVDVSTFQDCVQGNLTWGYCELTRVSPDLIGLRLLCDMEHELSFVFQTLSLSLGKPDNK